MIPKRKGLIVDISSGGREAHLGNVIHGMSKAATCKMTADMAPGLRPHGFTGGSWRC